MSDRELPRGDRDDAEGPRKGEKLSGFLERTAVEDHALPPPPDFAHPWRRWRGKPSVEERVTRIMKGLDPETGEKPREPGADDE